MSASIDSEFLKTILTSITTITPSSSSSISPTSISPKSTSLPHRIDPNLLPLSPTQDIPLGTARPPIPHPTDYILYFLLGGILGMVSFWFTYRWVNKYVALPMLTFRCRFRICLWDGRDEWVGGGGGNGGRSTRGGRRRRENSGARGGAGVLRPLEGRRAMVRMEIAGEDYES
jgi:hypothetical protein